MTDPTFDAFYKKTHGNKTDRLGSGSQAAIRKTPCSGHFDSCYNCKINICPIYKMKDENEQLRKATTKIIRKTVQLKT